MLFDRNPSLFKPSEIRVRQFCAFPNIVCGSDKTQIADVVDLGRATSQLRTQHVLRIDVIDVWLEEADEAIVARHLYGFIAW